LRQIGKYGISFTSVDESLLQLGSINFSFSSLMSGLLFGAIGMWMIKEARKKSNLLLVAIATTLMIYPMFTSSLLSDWGIGFLLCGIAYLNWNKN